MSIQNPNNKELLLETYLVEAGIQSPKGLTSSHAAALLEKWGPNHIDKQSQMNFVGLIINQIKSPLVWLLIVAAAIAAGVGELIDAAIVMFVVVFNTVIGVYQEAKAQQTFLALSRLTTSRVVVIRDGEQRIMDSADLVPGDRIVLHEGEKVPADAFLVEADNLFLSEAAITGESLPVHKDTVDVCATHDTCERLVWAGTYVTKGEGVAVVTRTGIRTRMGKIAEDIYALDVESPLQKRVGALAKWLVVVSVIAIVLVFILGLVLNFPTHELVRVSLSLLVSVVPEGLPLVMTLILSAGVYRMSKERVLIKQLESIETLGHTQIIAVDKTGTLTRNELVVDAAHVGHERYTFSGVGFDPVGEVFLNDALLDNAALPKGLVTLGRYAELSANARILRDGETIKVVGDPTEAAMRIMGGKMGLRQIELREFAPLIGDIGFDFKKKYYATVFQESDSKVMVVTGAAEVLLEVSSKRMDEDGELHDLDDRQRKAFRAQFEGYSKSGLRVIALAIRTVDTGDVDDGHVSDLTFVGVMTMKDALRASVPSALAKTREAGMRVVMITGDHVATAVSIAQDAGIYKKGDTFLSGPEIDELSQEELELKIETVTVFARMNPSHKMKIIQAYQNKGITIAMTGDGVNDVPPLAAADLGVAMGVTGTEAAKESADMVLLDDDFGNIPDAVAEGRHIVLSMKRVVLFLLSTNLAELFVIVVALVIGIDLPLTPVQIIWLNLITDSFLVIALGLLPRLPGLLTDTEYEEKSESFINKSEYGRMLFMIVLMTVGTLAVFMYALGVSGDYGQATSLALITMVIFQIFNAWNVAPLSEGYAWERLKPLVITSVLTLALFAFMFVFPVTRDFLNLATPTLMSLVVAFLVASTILFDRVLFKRS